MFYSKSYQVLFRESISTLVDLKVSPLASKSLFHKTEHKARRGEEEVVDKKLIFEGFDMQKHTIPTDGDQKVDEKNGVICVVIMFTAEVVIIKVLKMAPFSYFLLMTAKLQSQFGHSKCMWKISLNSFWNCYGLLCS